MKNRLQKMMSLVITATILSISISAFATKDYEKHGAKAQIDLWIDRGVVTGDGNGNFNPDKPITRAEFAAILQRVFNYVESSKTRFTRQQQAQQNFLVCVLLQMLEQVNCI